MPKKKKRELSTLRIILEVVILLFFIKPFFDLSILAGALYIFAVAVAFWNRIIFRKKNIAIMIVLGSLLAYFAGLFIPYIIGSYLAGDIISAVILALLALLMWSKGRKLKKGKK